MGTVWIWASAIQIFTYTSVSESWDWKNLLASSRSFLYSCDPSISPYEKNKNKNQTL